MGDFAESKKSASSDVADLTASTADGKQYQRTGAVKEEIERVLSLGHSEIRGAAKQVRPETLVYLIRHLGRDDDLRGELLQELSRHIVQLARRWVRTLSPAAAEEIILQVEIEILEIVLTEAPSRKSDFLEISFSQAVTRRTLNRVRGYKRSPMGHRDESVALVGDDDDESEPSLELLADPRSNPEEMRLALQDEAHRRELFRKALRAITNPRARKAVVLHYIRDWPIERNDGSKLDLVHYFNEPAQEIHRWLRKAMKEMRAAIGGKPSGNKEAAKRKGDLK